MRWDTLFADLGRYFEESSPPETGSSHARKDLDSAEGARDRDLIVTFSRLRKAGIPIPVTLIDGTTHDLLITGVGLDWVSGERSGGHHSTIVFPLSGLVSLEVPSVLSIPSLAPAARVSFSEALRVWSRNSLKVSLRTLASTHRGQVIGAGVDYLDLESGRATARRSIRRIRIQSLCWIAPCDND